MNSEILEAGILESQSQAIIQLDRYDKGWKSKWKHDKKSVSFLRTFDISDN